MREPIVPTHDVPLNEAADSITGFESLGIERHYGKPMEDLGGISLIMGVVWAYRNRLGQTSWTAVESMTLAQLNGYFPPEPEDPDESEPDSEMGKESTDGGQPTDS